ncbi:MAG: hypothetical protein LW690_15915, partial [Opitutaceae bacterium]|nr:hypothetical protein [Opitutaceae bacterium]
LASTGFCLAAPGASYLVFLPTGGECSLELAGTSAVFAAEWHLADGGVPRSAPAVAGGARHTLRSPFEGPAVLFLSALSPSTPTP